LDQAARDDRVTEYPSTIFAAVFALLAAGVVFVVGVCAVALISQEVTGSIPIVLKALVRLATTIIPSHERERYRHDWETDLKRFQKRPLAGLLWALDCFRAACLEGWDLRRRASSLSAGVRNESQRPYLGLTELQRGQLGDLFRVVSEHGADRPSEIDRARVEEAFVFACEHYAADAGKVGKRDKFTKVRKLDQDFMMHPVAVARICAGMRLDTETLCAALLHDAVEKTSASINEVRVRFGEEISGVVDGVTELTDVSFQSHDEAQAENYRKMLMATAADVRVILVKLADQLHNMRTIDALPKQQQNEQARQTLDVFAPIARHLGVQAIKWELDDLAFHALYPQQYEEIRGLVGQQRADREHYVAEAGKNLTSKLAMFGIEAQIAGRAKHFYSIYSKMTKQGRQFNEIYDLTAMRVIVDSVKDCYEAVGVIHSLWKPLPGRFKDFIAVPKLNMYQSLHTTVIGPGGRPLEIQVRTHAMHEVAEFGVAVGPRNNVKWLRSILGLQWELSDPHEFMESLKVGLFEDEIYVFTPQGEVRTLAAGVTPVDFAYAVDTEIGHRCVGARVNGKIVPLDYELRSGDIVEILTSKREQGPSRDWLTTVKTTHARDRIKQWFNADVVQSSLSAGREVLQEQLKKQGLPVRKITGSTLLADVIREMGYGVADDFYIALGEAKISAKTVVKKVLQRLKQGVIIDPTGSMADLLEVGSARRHTTISSGQYRIRVQGVEDAMLRLAKCCRPVPGDEIVGYVSLRRGITIHREDCPNTTLLRRTPERFTEVSWEGEQTTAFVVEIQVDAWDRHRLLEDLSRVFGEFGASILEARCLSMGPMVKNRFVAEVPDTQTLKRAVGRLRNIESVFDAYRVTPTVES
jgi:guanosine-3',5'-bis(diphosphate) 3'-pyrophosphohydrolase